MSYKIVIERDRVKIYDEKGNLVEEWTATLEDLKEAVLRELAENYYIEFEFTLPTGQVIKVGAKLEKVAL